MFLGDNWNFIISFCFLIVTFDSFLVCILTSNGPKMIHFQWLFDNDSRCRTISIFFHFTIFLVNFTSLILCQTSKNFDSNNFLLSFYLCKKYKLKVILFICKTKYHILKVIIKNSVISFFEVRKISLSKVAKFLFYLTIS